MDVNADAVFSPEWRVGALWLLEKFDAGETWFYVSDFREAMGCYPAWPKVATPEIQATVENLLATLQHKEAIGPHREFPGYPVRSQEGFCDAKWLLSKTICDVLSTDGCPDREFHGRRKIKPGIRDVVASYCIPQTPATPRKLVTVEDVAEMLVDVEAKTLHNSDAKKWGAPDGKVNRSRAWFLDRIRPVIEKTRQFKDV